MRKPRWRKARREALRAHGITAVNRQEVWTVTPANTKILPTWLRSRLVRGLIAKPGQFWLRPSDGAALTTFLWTISVRYSLTKTEFKRCPNCERPIVGLEAEAFRKAMEVVDRSKLICSPNCDKDKESGLWSKVAEVAA